jgi:methylmalonyl-CoA mutase cobalamin-binding subunit
LIDIIAKALHAADGQEIAMAFGEDPQPWEVCDYKHVYRSQASAVLDALREAGYVVMYRPECILDPGVK